MDKNDPIPGNKIYIFLNEISQLKNLASPYIVKFLEVY